MIERLDTPAAAISRVLDKTAGSPAKPVLRGDWLGHAVHPLLTDIPIGTFTSALVLDLLGADQDAATALVGVGLAATPAVLATGWSDWHDEEKRSSAIRRTGLVHAFVNAVGVNLHIASLLARRSGDRARGTALSAAGLAFLGVGGWLGGDLTYGKGSRVRS